MTEISFEDWEKLDLRIGEIKNVEDHPNADKLYVFTIDMGTEERTVVAGIKGNYEKDELLGRKVVLFTNLEPAVLRGVKSEGMILAAVDGDKVVLLQPEQDIANGAKVS